jgi:hypothetical protein
MSLYATNYPDASAEVLVKTAPVLAQETLWNRMVSIPSVMPSTADI